MQFAELTLRWPTQISGVGDTGICIAVTPQALPGWRSHAEQLGHLAFLLASTPKAPPSQSQMVCCFSVTQVWPTLWNPMDYNPLGSSLHEILQARILEWVAMPSIAEYYSAIPRTNHWYTTWTNSQGVIFEQKKKPIPISYYCGVHLCNNQNMMIVEMEDIFSGC